MSVDAETRRLSLLLFAEVKPHCVKLSALALMPNGVFDPDSVALRNALSAIDQTLRSHHQRHQERYRLATTLADYIFFPLSHLLQKPLLNDSCTRYILSILSFLLEYVWSFAPNDELLGQLHPLVLFLMGGRTNTLKDVADPVIALEMRRVGVSCLDLILLSLAADFFSADSPDALKRLALLGNTISMVLDVFMATANPASLEEVELANACLTCLDRLYRDRMTLSQVLQVLPGTVSKLVNFYTQSRGLHYTVIVNIIKVLGHVVVKVFDDEELATEPVADASATTLQDISARWNADHTPVADTASVRSSVSDHRSGAWLRATSAQLKVSLTIFFKDLLSSSSVNRLKVQTKTQIGSELVSFVGLVVCNCFQSLSRDLIPLFMDILPMFAANSGHKTPSDTNSLLHHLADVMAANTAHSGAMSAVVHTKLSNLVADRLSSIMLSVDASRMHYYFVSVKFHFALLHRLHADAAAELQLKRNFVALLQRELVRGYMLNTSPTKKLGTNDILSILSGSRNSRHSSHQDGSSNPPPANRLDNVELPPHINASKIATTRRTQPLSAGTYATNMLLLSKSQWQQSREDAGFFSDVYTYPIEAQILDLIEYLGLDSSELVHSVLATDATNEASAAEQRLAASVNLWLANKLLLATPALPGFDTDQFLDLSEAVDSQSEGDEDVYLVMDKSQRLMDDMASVLLEPEPAATSSTVRINEIAYSVALDSVGVLASRLPFEEFQQDFLVDYLYPVLEAVTLQSSPKVQSHALRALEAVALAHYGGSLEALVMDNLDYLINSLSLKLSMVSALTPSVPAILLVVLDISGMALLLGNQLQDLLSEMFTLIDTYHHYSPLVEGFFIVFGKLVLQIEEHYAQAEVVGGVASKYNPWGMTELSQFLSMVDDSQKIVDPYQGYDASKEYFRERRDVAFSEQMSDSDDEKEAPAETEAVWPSRIPQPVYAVLQKIFNYSFRLLAHPSVRLRLQILQTLTRIYPMLSTNYAVLLPLVSRHWPVLLALVAGAPNLSANAGAGDPDLVRLAEPAVQLAIVILREDERHGDAFLGRKFVEMWDFLSLRSQVFLPAKGNARTRAVAAPYSPRLVESYVALVVTGLRAYERAIPDSVAYEMTAFCWRCGLTERLPVPLGRQTRQILWVLQHT